MASNLSRTSVDAGQLGQVECITHLVQVLVDGPHSDKDQVVPRHSAPLSQLSLTPIVIAKLPRATGNGVVRKMWESEEVEKRFASSNWSKARALTQKRRQLNDFERFKVMKLRKQVGAYHSICGRNWSESDMWKYDQWNKELGGVQLANLNKLGPFRGLQDPRQGACERKGIDSLKAHGGEVGGRLLRACSGGQLCHNGHFPGQITDIEVLGLNSNESLSIRHGANRMGGIRRLGSIMPINVAKRVNHINIHDKSEFPVHQVCLV